MEHKKIYRYEMHVHCSEVSDCAKSTAAEMVHAFARAGYDGFVLTDHSVRGNCWMPDEMPWAESIGHYRDAYLSAKAAGDAIGFTVLFGWEHHYGSGKEVLTYGITPELLLAHPEIADLPIEAYAALVHAAGGYIAQAHPYRVRRYIDPTVEPAAAVLDGIEIYNASNSPEENIPAYRFAQKHGLCMISGSDSHRTDHNIALAGMAFDAPIVTGAELVAALRARKGRPIIGGELAGGEAEILPLLANARTE